MKKLIALLLAAVLALSLAGCGKKIPVELPLVPAGTMQPAEQTAAPEQPTSENTSQEETAAEEAEDPAAQPVLDENGVYDSRDDVALYLHTYGHLPANFITKKEAQALGWSSGSVEKYAPGKCIGGDRFGNYEGLLPKQKGRTYCECDIDTLGAKSRGAKRIIFSNDGLIYYTDDHYVNFTLLYGEVDT